MAKGAGAISTPKGGGALRGMGETFSPDLQTGTARLRIPIELPGGRNDLRPQFQLEYSSGHPNGPFGLGWSLTVPGITRKTAAGVPSYGDDDVFILSGSEELRPLDGPGSPRRYRPRVEAAFARIEHIQDERGDYWKVESRDGLVSIYGTPRPASSPSGWVDPATLSDPDPRFPERIAAWRLTSTTDTFENRIAYEWAQDREVGQDGRRANQTYLTNVRYHERTGTQDDYLVSVTVTYESRPDPFSDARAGFEVRTSKRCRSIEVRTHADDERLARTYDLEYVDDDELDAPLSRVSLLRRFRVTGHDGPAEEQMPPLEFGYTEFDPASQRYESIGGSDGGAPERSLGHGDCELVDLFGDGLASVLQLNGTARYWRNRGDGVFDLPRPLERVPVMAPLSSPGVQIADLNGDARPDLVFSEPGGRSGYFPLRAEPTDVGDPFVAFDRAPSFELEDPDVRLVDLNGDGLTDVLRAGATLELFYSDGETGWTEPDVRPRDADGVPDVTFRDPRVRLADMSGDGFKDIVLVHDGRVEYHPYLGHGRWGDPVAMENSPRFEDPRPGGGYDPRRLQIGDFDGDGADDIAYVGAGSVRLWINRSGNGFSEPIEISGTPALSDLDSVRIADLLGSGTAGVLWTYDLGQHADSTYKFLDPTGGTKPYLLNRVDNHIGAVTNIEYAPSTRFYLEDEPDPETRWRTALPFPVQVMARVIASDEISGGDLTTKFHYRHGYWDPVDREFRGFARVEQLDAEELPPGSQAAPPVLTRTWFHLGPVGGRLDWTELDLSNEYWQGDPSLRTPPPETDRDAARSLRGRTLRTETYGVDGETPYTVSEQMHEVDRVTPASDSQPSVLFPRLRVERTTDWDQGDDPMTRATLIGVHDEYGQPRSRVVAAAPRRGHPSPRYLSTATFTTYAAPPAGGRYIVDRVASSTIRDLGDNDASQPLLDFLESAEAGTITGGVIGQTVHCYDGQAYQGLPPGSVGDHGALVRTLDLALTDEVLHDAYRSRDDVLTPPEEPPYLASPPAAWPDEYPQAFRDVTSSLGYVQPPEAPSSELADGHWVVSECNRYDVHSGSGRGVISGIRDPLGVEKTVTYDPWGLPVLIKDAAQLEQRTEYDYRTLEPALLTDPNGNRTAYSYSPLGLVEAVALLGKEGLSEGDAAEQPSVRYTYDLAAFDRSPVGARQPIYAHELRRERHRWDLVHEENEARAKAGQPPLTNAEIAAMFPDDEPTRYPERFVQTRTYSDGFGRVVQERTQAEPVDFEDAGLPPSHTEAPVDAVGHERTAEPVVVSGWKVYDNKGRSIATYEPFFAEGWRYGRPSDARLEALQTSTFEYDPRGRLVRRVNPDGSAQRTVYGVPGTIAAPDPTSEASEPTPWERYVYDENDEGGRTQAAGSSDPTHWDTPASSVMDALGRVIASFERTSASNNGMLRTERRYDARGNLTAVIDAENRTAFSYGYDLLNRRWREMQLDGGVRRTVLDAAGNEIEERDAKGTLRLRSLDLMARPTRFWARDIAGEPVRVRERILYGDSAELDIDRSEAAAANLLGRVARHYDEAGLATTGSCDFKGNVLVAGRRVISDAQIKDALANGPANEWNGVAFRVDWEPAGSSLPQQAAKLLDPVEFQTATRYDALNRMRTVLYPTAVTGTRPLLTTTYDRGGGLTAVKLDDEIFVERIAYNARGQRTLVAYGNDVMTRYAYEPRNFRLRRLRSERFAKSELTYRGQGEPLQDLAYDYDLAGNQTGLHDRTKGSGVPPNPDALDRVFTYTPLYWLRSATGREHDAAPPKPPWSDGFDTVDPTKARSYTETYTYDDAGNLRRLEHGAGPAGSFVREMTLEAGGNRLESTTTGGVTYPYAYDGRGNLLRETTSRLFEWDHADRLQTFRNQAGADKPPSVYAQYLYDAAGRRVKKYVRKGGLVEVTLYLAPAFEMQRRVKGGVTDENTTVHVLASERRVAQLRLGPALADDATPALKYHLADHLGSSTVVLDGSGALVSREEFTPYGETSFGGFAKKRYRFTGRERDEENGLYYHGARYYAPWLCRWVTCDPLGEADGANLYRYARCNPSVLVDPSGTQSGDPQLHLIQQSELRQDVTATAKGRGYSWKTRAQFQALGRQWLLGDIDVGHEEPFATTPPGKTTRVFAQPRSENRSLGATADKEAVAAARAKGQPVREKGVWPGAVSGTKYGQPKPSPNLEGLEKVKIPPVVKPPPGSGPVPPKPSGFVDIRLLGPMMNMALSGMQMQAGVERIRQGEVGVGTIDVAEATVGLGLGTVAPLAVEGGALVAGAGGGTIFLGGVAAGGGVALAAETGRAAVRGEPTPIEVMDQAYGSGFGSLYRWHQTSAFTSPLQKAAVQVVYEGAADLAYKVFFK